MLLLRLISRCIKRHKLQVEAFYPFLQKYMQPHQEHITLILISVVEACHELVSPDTLQPLIQTLLKEFISDYRYPHTHR
jgi:protein SDA1